MDRRLGTIRAALLLSAILTVVAPPLARAAGKDGEMSLGIGTVFSEGGRGFVGGVVAPESFVLAGPGLGCRFRAGHVGLGIEGSLFYASGTEVVFRASINVVIGRGPLGTVPRDQRRAARTH